MKRRMPRFDFVVVGRANANNEAELSSWLAGKLHSEEYKMGLNIKLIMIQEK